MSNFINPQYICEHSGQPFWNGIEYYATSVLFYSNIEGPFIWHHECTDPQIAFFHSINKARAWQVIKFKTISQ